MKDTLVTKIIAGSYNVAGYSVARSRPGRWVVSRGNGVQETYATLAQAIIGAKVLANVATEAEVAAFVTPISFDDFSQAAWFRAARR